MKIAIDLDNTILDYRKSIILFLKENNKKFLIQNGFTDNQSVSFIKSKIKQQLGDLYWQEVQAFIYAEKDNIIFYEDVDKSLNLLSQLGHDLYFVSHKSKYGLGKSKNINIKEIAIDRFFNWLNKSEFKKNVNGINFCETFNEKLEILANLNPSIIIDDLLKIHTEFKKLMPQNNHIYFILFEGSSDKNLDDTEPMKGEIIKLCNWQLISKYISNI